MATTSSGKTVKENNLDVNSEQASPHPTSQKALKSNGTQEKG